MRKIRKIITLMCLSLAVNACSCNRRHEVSFSSKNVSNQTNEKIVAQAYQNLSALACELVRDYDSTGGTGYITSIEYREDNKVGYRALVDLGDGYSIMASVSFNCIFGNADTFVKTVSKMNLDTAKSDFDAYAHWYTLTDDEIFIKLFDMDMLKALPDMDTKKSKIYIPYRTEYCCATYYDVNSSINTTTLTCTGSGATVNTAGYIYSYSPDKAEDKLIYDLMAYSINEYNNKFANIHN